MTDPLSDYVFLVAWVTNVFISVAWTTTTIAGIGIPLAIALPMMIVSVAVWVILIQRYWRMFF